MKIYIGNLSPTTVENDLQTIFSPVGTLVSVNIIKDKSSGKSRGFGFVEFQNKTDGTEAITQLDGHMLNGAKLLVSEAKEKFTKSSGTEQRGKRW
ncbi:MAG: RNA-binding protein [Bdellovibrionaceae bacterium]|nr:RNA-binding protein [Pseudobdellovibrionaceae bacterium]